MYNKYVKIIGAGLAGVEASLFLANRGIKVKLYEMRPSVKTQAHKTDKFGELVCSNSLKTKDEYKASGLLKKEMELLDSNILKAAYLSEIEAGQSLNVDREKFSQILTNLIKENKNIEVIEEEVTSINEDEITIIATGPLTSNNLKEYLKKLYSNTNLFFFDGIAPIVEKSSLDLDIIYYKSRYDKGDAKYLNIPLNKDEYLNLVNLLKTLPQHAPKDFEKHVYEQCMPVEAMAKRGVDVLRYGPLKPIGLEKDKIRPYAVIQLRPDDNKESIYNLVGFQTSLTYDSQKQILKSLPGMKNCIIYRYGSIHENFYLQSPKIINKAHQAKLNKNLFFAGQITGVEGYLESASSGLSCAISVYNYIKTGNVLALPLETIIGELSDYITLDNKDFKPMNSNFGLFLEVNLKKSEKGIYYNNRSLEKIKKFKEENKWI